MSQRRRDRTTPNRGRRPLLAGVVAAALICGLLTVGIQAAHATMIGITRVEVCKGGPVSGTFPFSVDGSTTPVWVAVGTCKGVAVKPGSNTVKELGDTSGLTRLGKIQITPASAGVSNLATRTATVFVPSGEGVITRFVNDPAIGVLKVCVVADASSLELIGQSFAFTQTVSSKTVGPISIVAGPPSLDPLNCSEGTSYAIGTAVNVAELPEPDVFGSNITVIGGTASNVNLSAGTVTATVTSTLTQVIYTNVGFGPPGGNIEVCVEAGDSTVPAGPWTFTITPYGSTTAVGTVNVLAGQCSGAVSLNPGQYTVVESFSPPDYVSAIAAVPSAALLASDAAEGTATFAVAANNDTTAIFTNDTLRVSS